MLCTDFLKSIIWKNLSNTRIL